MSSDGFITLQEVIVTPDHPRGIWRVAGVPLVPLLRALRTLSGEPLTAAADHYARRYRYPPEGCRAALAWLVSRRLVTAAQDL